MKKRNILFFLLSIFSRLLFAENGTIDSLLRLVQQTDSTTQAHRFMELKMALGDAYINELEAYDDAIRCFTTALNIAKKENKEEKIFSIDVEIGVAIAKQGKHEVSVAQLQRIIATIPSQYLDTKAKAFRFLAMNKVYMGDYSEAYQYQVEALNLYTQLNDSTNIVRVKVGICKSLVDQRQYEKALPKLTELLPMTVKLNIKTTRLTVLLLIGESYMKLNQLDKALKYMRESLMLAQKYEDESGTAWSYYYLGLVEAKIKSIENQGIEHLKEANKLAKLYSDLDLETESLQALAEIFVSRKQYDTALELLEKSYALAQKNNMKPIMVKIYKSIAAIYYDKNDIKSFKVYSERYQALKDSIINEKLAKSLTELRQSFEIERLEKQNELNILKKDNEIQRVKTYFNNSLIIAISVFASLISLLLYIRNKNHREKNQLLEDKNKEITQRNQVLAATNRDLEQFAHIISHDLKEPLRNIGSFSSLIIRKLKNTNQMEIAQYLTYITKSVKQMHDLLQDLLLYARFSNKKREIVSLNPNNIIQAILDEKETTIKEVQAQITYEKSLSKIDFDEEMFKYIFMVLIDNALKFRREDTPKVNIRYQSMTNFHQFSIEDNGIGIEEKYFEKIFIIFERIHDREKYAGTSVGLATCKKILEACGGAIWVQSTLGVGSTFSFQIPKNLIS